MSPEMIIITIWRGMCYTQVNLGNAQHKCHENESLNWHSYGIKTIAIYLHMELERLCNFPRFISVFRVGVSWSSIFIGLMQFVGSPKISFQIPPVFVMTLRCFWYIFSILVSLLVSLQCFLEIFHHIWFSHLWICVFYQLFLELHQCFFLYFSRNTILSTRAKLR